MQAQFGPLRAPSVARDHVFSALTGRTADEALAAGEDPKVIWRAVCDDFDVVRRLAVRAARLKLIRPAATMWIRAPFSRRDTPGEFWRIEQVYV